MNAENTYQPGQYPEIDALLNAIAKFKIEISSIPATDAIQQMSFCTLKIRIQSVDEELHIEDEYGDGQAFDNPAMLLHLLLQAMMFYEDSSDISTWSRDYELDPARVEVLDIYRSYARVFPKIRSILGYKIKPLAVWDYTMNTTVTQVLRSMSSS